MTIISAKIGAIYSQKKKAITASTPSGPATADSNTITADSNTTTADGKI